MIGVEISGTVYTETGFHKVTVVITVVQSSDEGRTLVVSLAAQQACGHGCPDRFRIDAGVLVFARHVLVVRLLVVGYEHGAYVVFGGKRTVIIYSGFIKLVVYETVDLFDGYFGGRVDRVRVGIELSRLLVVGVKRNGFVEGLLYAGIVVERSPGIDREAFHPRQLPTQIGRNGVHLSRVFDVASKAFHVDERVAAVHAGQIAIVEPQYLEGRGVVGVVDGRITRILAVGARTGNVEREHKPFGQCSIQFG